MQAVPHTDKVESGTLPGALFVATQDSYKAQYPGFAAKQKMTSKEALHKECVKAGCLHIIKLSSD